MAKSLYELSWCRYEIPEAEVISEKRNEVGEGATTGLLPAFFHERVNRVSAGIFLITSLLVHRQAVIMMPTCFFIQDVLEAHHMVILLLQLVNM